jgi:hypothetical protein
MTSVTCPDCGAVAGYGRELAHLSDCPSLKLQPIWRRPMLGQDEVKSVGHPTSSGSDRAGGILANSCQKSLADRQSTAPGFWMNETSGVLRPAIEAYLAGGAMSEAHVAAMRAYLRQWIMAPVWDGFEIMSLRKGIDALTSRAAIHRWLVCALAVEIDPL